MQAHLAEMLLQMTVFNAVLWGEIYEEIVFDILLCVYLISFLCIMPFFLFVLQLKKQDDGLDVEEPLIAEDNSETSQYMKM